MQAATNSSAGRSFEDIALPIETDSTTASASTTVSVAVVNAGTVPPTQLETTVAPDQPQDKTIAIALVIAILLVIVVFTLAYVLYQKRRKLCGRGQNSKDLPDLSANEVLITPVKANGGNQSAPPGGLISGPRESRTRQSAPRKWYDSAALKYMDQSTDTLDRV